MEESLILVDEDDQVIGFGGKLETHQNGKLHRAFSIFVFDRDGRVLLQKRADSKYHSRNLWSNTCCGHPRPDESTLAAARRRLVEEMGIDCDLHEAFSFIYRAEMDQSLIENEFDHVFIGKFDGNPIPNPNEVSDWKWIDLKSLREKLETRPQDYTYWLSVSIDQVESVLHGRVQSSEKFN